MAIGTKDILIQVKGDNKDFNAAMVGSSAAMRTFGATTAATTGAAATGLTALTGAVVGQTAIVTSSTAVQAAAITASQSKIRKESGLTVDEVRDLSKAMREASGDIKKQGKIWDDYAHKAKDAREEVDKSKTVTERYRQVQEKLNKTLDKGKKRMASLGAAIKKSAKAFAIMGAAILGVGLLVGKLIGKSIEYARVLQKVNAQTGIAIDELSAYSYAAGQAAVEFNDFTEAIKDLNDRVYDAAEGNKDLIDTFNKLGVNIRDNNGKLKDSKTIFEEVGRAIGKIQDPAEKTNVAMALMADNGYKMIPIFNDMNDFIENTDFAKLNGMVMTEDDVERLRETDSQYNKLKDTIGAISNELALDLLPITEAVISLLQWGAENVLPAVARGIQLLSVPLRIIIDSFRIVAIAAEAAWYAMQGNFKKSKSTLQEVGYLVADMLQDNADSLWNKDRETEAIKEAGIALKSNLDIQREINDEAKDARYIEAQRREDAWLASGGVQGQELPKLFNTTTTDLSPAQVQAINMNITTGDIVNQGDVEEFFIEMQDAMSSTRSGI